MIIVYGGTFNPPTVAHQLIAIKLLKTLNQEIHLLPVGENYPWKSFYVPFKQRFEMLKLAFNDEILKFPHSKIKKLIKAHILHLND